MEAAVEVPVNAGVEALLEEHAHLVVDRGRFLEVGAGEPWCRQRRGHPLKESEGLHGVLVGRQVHARDLSTNVVPVLDEPLGLEPPDGLTDGDDGDAVLLGEDREDEPITGRVAAIEDPGPQFVVDESGLRSGRSPQESS